VLTAVPDLVPTAAWVQVIGRVAVHHSSGEPHRLTGSGQRLLAVLVAAGPGGATAERIAEEIWGDEQPNPWRPALRMAVARLRKQLPDQWAILADGGSYRITTHDGWIDAWRLEEIASSPEGVIEDDLIWILAGPPFGDIDLLEMIRASTQNLQMLQVAVAERFCSQSPTSLSTATCSALTSLLRDHPFNDRLAVVLATALTNAGRSTEALLGLTAFADSYQAEFSTVPADVARFLSSGPPSGEQVGEDAAALITDAPEIAKELRHLTGAPFRGRDQSLEALLNSHGALVTGLRGSGKSRLLTALIVANPAIETTYVVGDDRLDLPLGPFAVAMPTLRDELLASGHDEPSPGRTEGSAERAAATRAWRLVLAHLEARSVRRPQRLVVDDAHLLDSTSLGLLRLLIRSNTAADLGVVVCGRSDSDDIEWADLVRDAERAGLDPVELGGLSLVDLEEMVYEQFPGATSRARLGLARDVLEVSDGLPAVAAPLIAAADPTTLALPEQLAGVHSRTRLASTFSEAAGEVVAAASVLGHQFSIGTLIALSDLDESMVFSVLDELWSSGLIVETSDPDQVRFRHVLLQRAFLEGVPRFRRAQLHRHAAELVDDPHLRADHQSNATGLVPADVAVASLRESARLFAERRQWRKVARQVRRIAEIPGDHLDAASMTLLAIALDQSGADGSIYRRRAYEAAVGEGDWISALEAALSGLPEAELPDGDPERVAMLEGISSTDLPESMRFDRVFHLSRQCALMGEFEDALHHADEALAIAGDPEETGLSHVLRWTATRHKHAQAHIIPDEIVFSGSPRIQTRIAQINALNLAEQGDFAGSRQEADRFLDLTMELGDPLRIWQAQSLQGMYWFNNGEFDIAETRALENMRFAQLHDIKQGAAVYIGQRVFSYDCQHRLSELEPVLEPFLADLQQIALGRAAIVLSKSASSRSEANLGDEVRDLAAEVLERGHTLSLLAIMFMTRFMPEHAPELVADAKALLKPFGANPILAGFGAGTFGPAVRYVAQLTGDPEERMRLIEQSIEAADDHDCLLWRVQTRLDAVAGGQTERLDEAREVAAGSGFVEVVERFVGNQAS